MLSRLEEAAKMPELPRQLSRRAGSNRSLGTPTASRPKEEMGPVPQPSPAQMPVRLPPPRPPPSGPALLDLSSLYEPVVVGGDTSDEEKGPDGASVASPSHAPAPQSSPAAAVPPLALAAGTSATGSPLPPPPPPGDDPAVNSSRSSASQLRERPRTARVYATGLPGRGGRRTRPQAGRDSPRATTTRTEDGYDRDSSPSRTASGSEGEDGGGGTSDSEDNAKRAWIEEQFARRAVPAVPLHPDDTVVAVGVAEDEPGDVAAAVRRADLMASKPYKKLTFHTKKLVKRLKCERVVGGACVCVCAGMLLL